MFENNGVVWFRKEFNLPASMLGKSLRLFLGNVVDRDSVYINGTSIGATQYQYPPRKYSVPAGQNGLLLLNCFYEKFFIHFFVCNII